MAQKEQVSTAQCVAVACLTIAAKLDGPDAVDNVAKFQVLDLAFLLHVHLLLLVVGSPAPAPLQTQRLTLSRTMLSP